MKVLLYFVLLLLSSTYGIRILRGKLKKDTMRKMSVETKNLFNKQLDKLRKLNEIMKKKFGIKNVTKESDNDAIESKLKMNPLMYQGDIILSDKQIDGIINESTNNKKKRSVTNDVTGKWDLKIYYEVEPDVNKKYIQLALSGIEEETCLKFIHGKPPKQDKYLRYFKGDGCYSYVGKMPGIGPQDISIGSGCDSIATILHETSHALGLYHEMSRSDRDKYITIKAENIDPRELSNFNIHPESIATSYNVGFNYGSIMLYHKYSFSINRNPTIFTNRYEYKRTMGQEGFLKFTDIKMINMHYCSKICPKQIPCKNGGYPNPKDCVSCLCPRFFTGVHCTDLEESDKFCGDTYLKAGPKKLFHSLSNKKRCYIKIEAQKGKKIRFTIVTSQLAGLSPCQQDRGLEVKLLEDKTVSGAMICKINKNLEMISEGTVILLLYTGIDTQDYVNFSYEAI
uniref:Zinc metalloproteinase n=1 Tax=Parastrongyloides trichosuri TaxID=131310 RepID=A0A0N4Z573_PARTI